MIFAFSDDEKVILDLDDTPFKLVHYARAFAKYLRNENQNWTPRVAL